MLLKIASDCIGPFLIGKHVFHLLTECCIWEATSCILFLEDLYAKKPYSHQIGVMASQDSPLGI
jgi:hypothetical protein